MVAFLKLPLKRGFLRTCLGGEVMDKMEVRQELKRHYSSIGEGLLRGINLQCLGQHKMFLSIYVNKIMFTIELGCVSL